jgi:protein-S-isoprenylcysteine O-methyltransferase Ste14
MGEVPALFLVVILEERELRQRFGDAHVEYCRRVPRFVPRRAGN